MNDISNTEMQRSLALAASLARLEADPDFTDLSRIPELVIDLRYASANNFMGVDLYGAFNRAFLRKTAADQLRTACEILSRVRPGHRFLVLDATRPRSVQQRLWAHVRGTPQECYVADPAAGSIHNFGFAVDLTIIDPHGAELDMGTPFDAFDDLSQPALQAKYRRAGLLSGIHMENRMVLHIVMDAAGFTQHPLEWWHFDAVAPEIARAQAIVE
jgi:D-alanyl-D-alanine dipeptidase